jgi:hypothetical protein
MGYSRYIFPYADEFDPSIRDYEPPSPIKLSIDVNLPNKPEGGREQETITEMSTSKKLELILTEVELSHRFIHF